MNLRYISCARCGALHCGEMGKRKEPPASREARGARRDFWVYGG